MKRTQIVGLLVLTLVLVIVTSGTAHAATGTFDPSASWSDWFWHYSGVAIQTVYGWFGKCMPDITGQACAIP